MLTVDACKASLDWAAIEAIFVSINNRNVHNQMMLTSFGGPCSESTSSSSPESDITLSSLIASNILSKVLVVESVGGGWLIVRGRGSALSQFGDLGLDLVKSPFRLFFVCNCKFAVTLQYSKTVCCFYFSKK